MTVDCVTEDLLKYFDNDALSFKVYGTPTTEKFRKQLTMADNKKEKEKDKKASASKAAASKTTTVAETKKTETKGKVVKMTTPDGKEVEVIQKGGCCIIF
mmetsp:Transcript_22249/g.25564  ORF Transcript_22249/g.25564 Transcript_22249/m.25564 type:complete len:100 (-) Transcript_22249:7-306(-)